LTVITDEYQDDDERLNQQYVEGTYESRISSIFRFILSIVEQYNVKTLVM